MGNQGNQGNQESSYMACPISINTQSLVGPCRTLWVSRHLSPGNFWRGSVILPQQQFCRIQICPQDLNMIYRTKSQSLCFRTLSWRKSKEPASQLQSLVQAFAIQLQELPLLTAKLRPLWQWSAVLQKCFFSAHASHLNTGSPLHSIVSGELSQILEVLLKQLVAGLTIEEQGSPRIIKDLYFFLSLPSFAPSARKQALCIS